MKGNVSGILRSKFRRAACRVSRARVPRIMRDVLFRRKQNLFQVFTSLAQMLDAVHFFLRHSLRRIPEGNVVQYGTYVCACRATTYYAIAMHPRDNNSSNNNDHNDNKLTLLSPKTSQLISSTPVSNSASKCAFMGACRCERSWRKRATCLFVVR